MSYVCNMHRLINIEPLYIFYLLSLKHHPPPPQKKEKKKNQYTNVF